MNAAILLPGKDSFLPPQSISEIARILIPYVKLSSLKDIFSYRNWSSRYIHSRGLTTCRYLSFTVQRQTLQN